MLPIVRTNVIWLKRHLGTLKLIEPQEIILPTRRVSALSFYTAFVGVFSTLLLPSWSPAQSSNYVLLRTTTGLSDYTQHFLAGLAPLEEREIPQDTEPEAVIRAYCGGSITQTYLGLVANYNPTFVLKKESTRRVVKLPACPSVLTRATVPVFKGDTITTILAREMGTKPRDVISVCEPSKSKPARTCTLPAANAVAMVNGGAKANLDNMSSRNEIYLPFTTDWTTIPLKPGVKAADAVTQLQAAASPDRPLQVAVSPILKLIHPLRSHLEPSCGTDPGANWPFDQERVAHALQQALHNAAVKTKVITPTVVRVADTGITGLHTAFLPDMYLAANTNERDGDSVDNDHNGFAGDRYGIGTGNTGNITPDRREPDWLHGTEVADLTLGGDGFRASFPDVAKLIRLNFANIVSLQGGQPSIDASMLGAAISVSPPTPILVNISVGGGGTIPPFEDTVMRYAGRVTVVVAAGNDGIDLDTQGFYPASYGGRGSLGSELIVVGSHDPNRRRTSSSNYGKDTVDILAPGCALPFIGPDGESDRMDGTSGAAPLVTFTAALLNALGVKNSDIKMRIIAAGDYYNYLEDDVGSGSTLNIERAIHIFEDVLQKNDTGADEYGEWFEDNVVELCTKPVVNFAKRSILKIDYVGGPGGRPHLRYLFRGPGGQVETVRQCEAKMSGTRFIGPSDKQPVFISWENVRTLVPAYSP